MNETQKRDNIIIKASVIGIIANVLLAGFKAVIGLTVGSIAIVMDAVNNISDAASSVITIVGTKLAGRDPDKKHPFGYGRIEYLSAMIISMLVLYAGIMAFVESVKKIIEPQTPDYSTVSLVIVGVAVLVKILLGNYVKKTGETVNSDSLINSGSDALMDAIISAATLAAAAVYLIFGLSLEAWLGAVIAIVIIKAGIEMLKETLSKILGERVDAELTASIKATIREFPEVRGAYDLVLHDYGPDSYNGSVHIEVPDTMSAGDLDKLLRKIQMKVYKTHNVLLTAVGIYSHNTKDPEAIEAREKVATIISGVPDVLQMHGFYIDKEEKSMRFDIVVSFAVADRKKVYREAMEAVQQAFPDHTIVISMDTDFTDVE